jgi:hypothetical protein
MQVPARFRSQRFDMAFIAADLSSNNFVPTLSAVSDGQAPLIDGQDWLSGDKRRLPGILRPIRRGAQGGALWKIRKDHSSHRVTAPNVPIIDLVSAEEKP